MPSKSLSLYRSIVAGLVASALVVALLVFLFMQSMRGGRHRPIVVSNQSSLPLLVDRMASGAMASPGRSAYVPPLGSAVVAVDEVRGGDAFRFWDASRRKLLERRFVDEEDLRRNEVSDEFMLEYP